MQGFSVCRGLGVSGLGSVVSGLKAGRVHGFRVDRFRISEFRGISGQGSAGLKGFVSGALASPSLSFCHSFPVLSGLVRLEFHARLESPTVFKVVLLSPVFCTESPHKG